MSAAAITASVLVAGSAQAVGGDPVADGTFPFTARITVGDAIPGARSCTGALVAPQWVITARACFGTEQVPLGAPSRPVTVTVGRTDLNATGGHVAPVVWLAPHPDRAVVLAKLATPAAGVAPVRVATSAPAVGDEIQAAGYGRTRTEWVPGRLHAAEFTVDAVGTGTLAISPTGNGAICKGDAGGPALRTTSNGPELVGLHHTSAMGGCLAEDGPDADAVEARVDDLAGWIRQTAADVQIYGALPDGRLTYSVIDSAGGDRLTTVTSTAGLGFTPRAIAALNATTLLVTTDAGRLHRVDITANNPVLTFDTPVFLGTGWSHRMLSYDGDGSLFGFADDSLRRYTVTSAKPVPGHITNYTVVQSTGYGVIRNLAATGPDHVIGSTGAGALRSYPVPATGVPGGVTLATNGTWGSLDALVSPGRGLYYGRTAAGALLRFRDPAPYDQNGGDIQYFADDPVDRQGWTTPLLAAVPFDAQPQNAVDVSVFGFTADRRLTFTAIDSVTGTRHGSTVVAAEPFPFAPGAIATLNFNTVLITDPADENRLYRLDIVTTKPALVFNRVPIATGWSHRLLSYDGRGSLFGIAENRLIRYTVRRTKPTGAADFTGRVQVGDGYTLRTFAATAPGYVMGTTGTGELVGYPIDAAGRQVRRDSLAANGWTYPVLFSPGNGNYFARTTAGGVLRFRDPTPANGQGNDITAVQGPVDTAGWSQPQLSAQPYVS